MSPGKRLESCECYTVGWIAALPVELTAAHIMLDEEHDEPEDYQPRRGDSNSYTWGRIGAHNVVIAALPIGVYGTISVATTATALAATFPQIRFGLLVGIGGAIATPNKTDDTGFDIRLGDVAVSQPSGTNGGVIQYDLGEAGTTGWKRKGSLNRPPDVLLKALSRMQADHMRKGARLPEILKEALDPYPRMLKSKPGYPGFKHQGAENDRLFSADFDHVGGLDCSGCERNAEIERAARDTTDPEAHYGTILSGNRLIKSASSRDNLLQELEDGEQCICFEMEAAGIMDNFPCLIIRGICDYADSHKNDRWQQYAAATAAGYAKELLGYVHGQDLQRAAPVTDILNTIQRDVQQTHDMITRQHLESQLEKMDEWLSPLHPGNRHRDVRSTRVPDTCAWICDEVEVIWLSRQEPRVFLCCLGDPGAGKTHLASLVIDQLETLVTFQQNDGLAYLYFDYRDQKQQTLSNCVGALTKQLLRQLSNIPPKLDALWRNIKTSTQRPDSRVSVEAFCLVCESFRRVFICLDALDEHQDLYEFLRSLHSTPLNVSYFTTGRRHVRDAVLTHFDTARILEVKADDFDVRLMLKHKIDEDRQRQPELMTASLEAAIIDKIASVAGGIFLLPALQVETVLAEITRSERRAVLATLSGSLNDAFGTTLVRIQEQAKPQLVQLALCVLTWVLLVREPLSDRQLLEACAIREQDVDLDRENFTSLALCLEVCLGLVVLDRETNTVRLVHFALYEFLTEKGSILGRTLQDGHDVIARACLAYLRFRSDERAEEDCPDDQSVESTLREHSTDDAEEQSYALLAYAACTWGDHIRLSRSTRTSMKQKALQYLTLPFQERRRGMEYLCARHHYLFSSPPYNLFHGYNRQPHVNLRNYPEEIWAPHMVAFFNATSLMEDMISAAGSVNEVVHSRDGRDRTPLHIAAWQGHEEMVKLLISKDNATVYFKDFQGQTPLHAAAWHGHVGVARLLIIEGGALVDARDYEGRTSLQLARESKDVMRVLIFEAGTNVDIGDTRGYTPLHFAVLGRDVEGARLLITEGQATLDAKNFQGNTPLQLLFTEPLSLSTADLPVAKVLIEEGASVDIRDQSGSTLLHKAARVGSEGCVTLLLRAGLAVDARDNNGKTPLASAASRGNEAVTKLLIVRYDAAIDDEIEGYLTPEMRRWCKSRPTSESPPNTVLSWPYDLEEEGHDDEPAVRHGGVCRYVYARDYIKRRQSS